MAYYRLACFAVAVAVAAPVFTFAHRARADGDVVLLKDGTQLTGTVVRQDPGRFVVIRTPDGREITLAWDDVKRVEASSPTLAAPPLPAASAPASASTPVQSAPGAAPASPPPAQRGGGPSVVGAGVGLSAETTFADAEAKRQEWLKRGGGITSYEIRGQGYLLLTPPVRLRSGYIDQATPSPLSPYPYYADATVEEGKRGFGGGGGVGFRIALLNLSLPDPSTGNTWSAFRIGSGFDATFAYLGFPTTQVSSETNGSPANGYFTRTTFTIPYEGMSAWLFTVPLTLGAQVGLGSFDGAEWHGVALGIAYTPSLTIVKIKDSDLSTSLNYSGFEASIDILDKNGPLASAAPKAHGRIFVFVLPPVTDKTPLLVNIGGGAVWY